MNNGVEPWRRVRFGLGLLSLVVALATLSYMALGMSALDALYQAVSVVFAVGLGLPISLTPRFQAVTIVVVLVGTGTVLFTLTMVIDALVEGRLSEKIGRRRMQQRLDRLEGHVVVCGLGQVGCALVHELRRQGQTVVAVDRASDALPLVGEQTVLGDATHDAVLIAAGIERASTLAVAMNSDADNLYVTLSARALNPRLFIVARANEANAEPKLRQAGADRVVNPHRMSGNRMAALVTQPHVSDFLDVVMHDRELEVRLVEVPVRVGSPFAGLTLQACRVQDRSGATVVAIRHVGGAFDTNPAPATVLEPGDVIIALGTAEQVQVLRSLGLR